MSNRQLAASMIEAENRDALKEAESAEDKLRIAFKGSKDHWMFTDEDDQMMGAIGAAMFSMTDEDRELVTSELRVLQAFSGAASGIPVDFSALEVPENVIGIAALYKESRK